MKAGVPDNRGKLLQRQNSSPAWKQLCGEGDGESVSGQVVGTFSSGPAQTQGWGVRLHTCAQRWVCPLDKLDLSLSSSHGRPDGFRPFSWDMKGFTAPWPSCGQCIHSAGAQSWDLGCSLYPVTADITIGAERVELSTTPALPHHTTHTPIPHTHTHTHTHFSSVTQSCLTLCNLMDCSTPGFPVHHQLPELAQTHVHLVGDAIQPSHPLLSPIPPAFNLSQHQGLFQ